MPIQVNNLFFSYSKKLPTKVEALNNISFAVNDGEFIAIVGETGSGKSTLIQNLNGLIIPDSGTIKVNDFLICNKKRKNKTIKQIRKLVGVVFQFPENQLFEETVEKDVSFGPKNFGIAEEEAIKISHDAMSLVGLGESYYQRSPFELSGGERRRVALAGILALKPDILVLDEPTTGLDPKGQLKLMGLLDKLNSEGTTIIIVTHNMSVVLKHSKRVIELDKGNIVFDGNTVEYFNQCKPSVLPDVLKLAKLMNVDFNLIKEDKDILKYVREVKHD